VQGTIANVNMKKAQLKKFWFFYEWT
jgi:hypothetical protein